MQEEGEGPGCGGCLVSWWGLLEAMDQLAVERSEGDEGFADGGLEVNVGGVAGQRGAGNHCAHAVRGGERPGEDGARIVQRRAHGGAQAGDLLLPAVSRVLENGFLRFQDPNPIPDFLQGFLSGSGCSGRGEPPPDLDDWRSPEAELRRAGGEVGMSKFHGAEILKNRARSEIFA